MSERCTILVRRQGFWWVAQWEQERVGARSVPTSLRALTRGRVVGRWRKRLVSGSLWERVEL